MIRTRLLIFSLFLFSLAFPFENSVTQAADSSTPNVVVIFIDDMGYGDIGPFGVKGIDTPNLNRMAKEGRKFTDFIVSSAVCSASRAALLTGCYHRRIGISGALFPYSQHGLNSNEMTIAELVKQKNYATACFGKWHIGHHQKFLPLQHGFDEYTGLPYSNDMWPYAYDGARTRRCRNPYGKGTVDYPELPLIEGNKVVDHEVTGADQANLTTLYTEKAVNFINRNKDKPFFLYVPHTMVHTPIFVSKKFKGKSKRGLYGDVVMELDWSVGRILDTLKKNNIDENTLVVFTADNGPWLNFGDHAGLAGPLREGKGTEWEGGIREPTIMRWPGKIPANTVCDELASTIDLLPTIAAMTGAKLPDHKIDGNDIRPLMFGEKNAKSPHTAFPGYYAKGQLQMIRDRQWKLVFPHRYRSLKGKPGGSGGIPGPYGSKMSGLELYDLKNDIGETTNVADKYPQHVKRLSAAADEYRKELGDTLQKIKTAPGIRPAGKLQPGDKYTIWKTSIEKDDTVK